MHSELRQPTHFFTVDVEEYFQVRALRSVVSRDEWLSGPSRVAKNIDDLLACLDRHNVRATFFVLGWIARYRPEVARGISNAGHEIASHGFWHEQVTALKPAEFLNDVQCSKCELEDVTGAPVLGYRAPSFSIIPGREWAFDVLIEAGYI